MRFRLLSRFSLGIFLSLLLFLDGTFGSLMLGSLLMALKGSIFAGKMGMGGLLAMIYAASQNPNGHTSRQQTAYTPISLASLGKKRAVRSVHVDAEFNPNVNVNSPPDLKEMMNREIIPDSDAVALLQDRFNETSSNQNSTLASAPVSVLLNETHVHLSAEKLAETLNDTQLPVTQRVMRQVAILDQLSCLPKVICGMNTRAPSSKTNIINDYGYLIKFLFERDSEDEKENDDDQDDDDAAADDDEDDDDVYSRAEQLLRTAMSKGTKDAMSEAAALLIKKKDKVLKAKKKRKPSKNEDDEEDDDVELDDEEDEEEAISRAQLADSDINSDDKLDDMAQDELLEENPEMLRYVLTEMKQKMRKHKPSGYPDHSYLPGYDIDSYATSDRVTQLLNTDSSQAILKGGGGVSSWYGKGASSGPYSDSKGVSFGHKGTTFTWGPNDKNEEDIGFLGSLFPSFSFTKTSGTKGKVDDDFASDPFFAGFKRSMRKLKRQLRLKKQKENGRNQKGEVEGQTEGQDQGQRANSKFRRMDDYIEGKKDEIRRSDDPLTKYRVAEEVGRQAGSNRQCRLLFAKCPYEFTEIMSMIDNVKKLVTSSATVDDQKVQLKQNILGSASADTPVVTTNAGGSVVNLQTGNGGSPGITSISHQLENGDKVEIMLKIKPKESNVTPQKYKVIPVGSPSTHIAALKRPDPSVLAANKSLYEMKKAIQAIAKIHNETELKLNSMKEKQQQQQLAQLLSSVGLASSSPNLNEPSIGITGTKSEGSKVKGSLNKKQAQEEEAEAGSTENDSNSSSQQDNKSSEENYSGGDRGRKPATGPGSGTGPAGKSPAPKPANSGPFIIDYSQQGTTLKSNKPASSGASTTSKAAGVNKDKSQEDEGSASEEDEEQDGEGEEESGEDQDQDDDHAPIRNGFHSNNPHQSPEMRYPGMGYGPGSQAHLYRRRQQMPMQRTKPRPQQGKPKQKPKPQQKSKPKSKPKPAPRPIPTQKPASPGSGPFIIDYTKQGTNSYPHPPIAENQKSTTSDLDADADVETSRVSNSNSAAAGVRKRQPSISLPPKPSPYRILKKRPRVERPKPKDPKEKNEEEKKKEGRIANEKEEENPDSLESLRF